MFWLTINAFTASDKVLVPVAPGYFELDSIVQIGKTIQEVRQYFNPSIELTGLLYTMSDPTVNAKTSLSVLRQTYTGAVLKTLIPRNTDIRDAHFNKQDIFTFSPRIIESKPTLATPTVEIPPSPETPATQPSKHGITPSCYHAFKLPCEHDKVWLSVSLTYGKNWEVIAGNRRGGYRKTRPEQSYVKRLTVEQEKSTKDIDGILVPSAFQVPNEVVDDGWLKEFGGAEVKVLLYIIRKTFGFNKIAATVSPSRRSLAGRVWRAIRRCRPFKCWRIAN